MMRPKSLAVLCPLARACDSDSEPDDNEGPAEHKPAVGPTHLGASQATTDAPVEAGLSGSKDACTWPAGCCLELRKELLKLGAKVAIHWLALLQLWKIMALHLRAMAHLHVS